LTTFDDSNDSGSDFTITAKTCEFDTMERVANSYVFKDYTASYFDDFEIEFEAEIEASDTDGQAVLCLVSNTAGTKQDQFNANDGIWVAIYNSSGNLVIEIVDGSNVDNDQINLSGTTMPLRYFTLKRVGTTTTVYLYSDSARTSLINSKSVTGSTVAMRYLHCVASREVSGTEDITGYTQNFEIVSN